MNAGTDHFYKALALIHIVGRGLRYLESSGDDTWETFRTDLKSILDDLHQADPADEATLRTLAIAFTQWGDALLASSVVPNYPELEARLKSLENPPPDDLGFLWELNTQEVSEQLVRDAGYLWSDLEYGLPSMAMGGASYELEEVAPDTETSIPLPSVDIGDIDITVDIDDVYTGFGPSGVTVPIPSEFRGIREEETSIDSQSVEQPESKKNRYLNIYFTQDAAKRSLYDPLKPLYIEQTYYLCVLISPEHIGIGDAGDLEVPEGVLAEELAKGPVDLEVLLTSNTLRFGDDKKPAYFDKLSLPPKGESTAVVCKVTAATTGEHMIDIDLLYKGNILKDVRYIVQVVSADQVVAPAGAQEASVRASAMQALQPDDLQALSERKLTFKFDWIPDEGRYNAVFVRTPDDAPELYETHVGADQMNQFRFQTSQILHNMCETYKNFANDAANPNNKADAIREAYKGVFIHYLRDLARNGRAFYNALFEHAPSSISHPQIEAGSVIQVVPLRGSATAPWNLVYDEDINSDASQLCPDFRTHEIGKCPHADDPDVICPQGFWGYRYIVEQLPSWYNEPVAQREDTLDLGRIINNIPRDGFVVLATGIHSDFTAVATEHLTKLNTSVPVGKFGARIIYTKDDLLAHLRGEDDWGSAHVVYFFVHGEVDSAGIHVIKIGADVKIDANDLDNLRKTGLARDWKAPLVFLNGCETGNYGPWHYDNLISAFQRLGASGVIGTQCTIYPSLASDFGYRFYTRVFQQEAVGEALWHATRELMDLHSPFGLVYGLFASADLILARQILTTP